MTTRMTLFMLEWDEEFKGSRSSAKRVKGSLSKTTKVRGV